jgi:hypothetical protein
MGNWQVWLKGLVSAAIGGAATAISTMIVAPEEFNLDQGIGKVAAVAVVSAIVAAANYLKQSPIPTVTK